MVRPAFSDGQVEDLQRGLLGREVSSSANGLPEPGVQRLDPVGRVDQLPDLDWEVEERHELRPEPFPHPDHRRILLPPGAGELGESGLGRGKGGAV